MTAPITRLSALLTAALLAACTTLPPIDSVPSARNELPRRWAEPAAAAGPTFVVPAVDANAATLALLEDSLRPGVKLELNEAETRENLWLRVRAGFAMPTLDNEGVRRADRRQPAYPLLRRHLVLRRLWPIVRGHARADARVLADPGRPARPDAGLLRT